MIRATAFALILATGAHAQSIDPAILGEALRDTRPTTPSVSTGTVATLRALDKVSGQLSDLEIPVGASQTYHRLTIDVLACRYPSDNPTSDAFAFLRIQEPARGEQVFQGWMIASSPALNALDHARYDVWVLSCR